MIFSTEVHSNEVVLIHKRPKLIKQNICCGRSRNALQSRKKD